jgi:hypothetical protein
VAGTVSDASRRAYGSYWKRLVDQWGVRRLDEPTPSEVKQLGERIRANVVVRSNARGGRSAVENFITALRCLCNQAVADIQRPGSSSEYAAVRIALSMGPHNQVACLNGAPKVPSGGGRATQARPPYGSYQHDVGVIHRPAQLLKPFIEHRCAGRRVGPVSPQLLNRLAVLNELVHNKDTCTL